MKKIAIVIILQLSLGPVLLVLAVLAVSGAGSGQAATTCGLTTATTANSPSRSLGALPATIGAYRGEQIINAGHIIVAAQALGLNARAQTIAVMTAIGESSLINVNHGDQAGPDSRGLFQQRGNGAWGSYTDRMNPQIAATNFLKALIAVPGWDAMAPTLAAHATQHNADPYHYEKFWADAIHIVSILTSNPNLAAQLPTTGGLPCPPGGAGTFVGPGGAFAAQTCSVIPDPTTDRGCLTPRMAALAAQLTAQKRSLSCWDAHAWNPSSDHPLGKACDVFPGPGGVLPTAAQKTDGDALAAALQASAKQTGIHYLIWYGRIWSIDHDAQGWQPYNGGGVYDPADITGGHYDHIHISVY
jgi:hypothetical protein